MKLLVVIALAILVRSHIFGSPLPEGQGDSNLPFIGAQVFIEPGQSPEEIDYWFKVLHDNNFTVCRIRMFEAYMKKMDGNWDFKLFDNAFASAEKYGIKVYGTVFPYTQKTDIGGFKFPSDEKQLESIAVFIKQLTLHFKQYKSLQGWVLINEPGVGGKLKWTSFDKAKFAEWKKLHPPKEYTEKGYPVLLDMTDQEFISDYNVWFLNWIASEIKKYDPGHELHVNNHDMFRNCSEYKFPEWRKFLNTLGGSAHASWHFGYFSRRQYSLAMSANSEMVRSGAGPLPWFMTELQGGNNTYSGMDAMCPTPEEITQWLWIITATEGRGSIFWSLNPRSSGIEAGEWALLNFQDQPSDRMAAASVFKQTVDRYPKLFSNYKEADPGINLLYIRQSLWAEKKLEFEDGAYYEARKQGGVMKSLLAYFETLSEMGVNANIKAFEEFDFNQPEFTGTTIILAHQISIPSSYAPILESFVAKGGKLIVDGLSGYFDENLHNTMKTGFAFEKLFGGNISEFKMADNLFELPYGADTLPAHCWRGYIAESKEAGIVSSYRGTPVAIRNKTGKGETIWVPSLIGLGSRISGDYTALSSFINKEAAASLTNAPVRFESLQKNVLMKTIVSGTSLITIIVNKNTDKKVFNLRFKDSGRSGNLIFHDKEGECRGNTVSIRPEETMVIDWRR